MASLCLRDGETTVALTRQQCDILHVIAKATAPIGAHAIACAAGMPLTLDDPGGQVKVRISQIRSRIKAAGMPSLIEAFRGCGYYLTRPVEVTGAEPFLLIPGSLRPLLERLMHTHPNRFAADRFLARLG